MAAELSLRALSGQNAAARALADETLHGHVPSAVLICGPAGVGKKTLAEKLICAALYGCTECDSECPRFLRVHTASHPDLHVLDDEKSVKIDDARAAIHEAERYPLEAARRVIYVPHADRMTPQTQNCLLKALEEPPADAIFILVANDMSALLTTVLSRMRVVRMQAWPDERVSDALVARGTPKPRADEAARDALGSIGKAIELCESEQYFEARARALKWLFGARRIADIADACAAYRDEKDGGEQTLDIITTLLRDALQVRLGLAGEERLAGFPDLWLLAARQAPIAGLTRLLVAVDTARRQRASQVSWQAALEGLLFQMTEEYELWQL